MRNKVLLTLGGKSTKKKKAYLEKEENRAKNKQWRVVYLQESISR